MRSIKIVNDWSTLPDHLLDLIVERLDLPDLFRFVYVCKSWGSVCGLTRFQNHLPWLIVPHQNYTTSKPGTMAFDNKDVGFFSLCDGKIYKAEIPEIVNRRIYGSFPGGWLMTVHDNSEVQLLNPFSRCVVHLPPLTKFPGVLRTTERNKILSYVGTRFDSSEDFRMESKYMRDAYIKKVAMSSSSITSGTIIMAIQGLNSTLVFYRIGGNWRLPFSRTGGTEEVWTTATPSQNYCHFQDLTYYKGKFYAVHRNAYVFVVHGLDTQTLPFAEQALSRYREESAAQYYILESSGDLLVVLRFLVGDVERNADKKYVAPPNKTKGFKVLKVDLKTPRKWVEIESLGDRSIFLGQNSSFSLSSCDSSGFKPNRIYFTDNSWDYFHEKGFGGHDLGIFNLEDGSVEKFLYPSDTLLVMPPPFWFALKP